jgi:hypothetical protein
MWNWYEWESIEDFNTWHENLKQSLNYPLPAYNQATGEELDSSQWTTEYTFAYQVEQKTIARVEQDKSEGLVLSDLRPPETNIEL